MMETADDLEFFRLLNALNCITSVINNIISSRRQQKRSLFGLLQYSTTKHNRDVIRGPYCRFGTSLLLTALQDGRLDLRQDFRVSRRSFLKLTTVIKDEKHHGWQPEIELLIFLFWLACGCAYRVVSRSCGIPVPSICRIVHKQLMDISRNLHKFIHLPKQEEYAVIAHGFKELSGTPVIDRALGAVDGTHVSVTPPTNHKEAYINRKCQFTVQTQAVCNHEGLFIDIFTGFPGSVHDARVYRSSPIVTEREYPPRGYYLLGDTAYPASNTMLTPYKQPEAAQPVNTRFNYHHSKARSIIERAFGQLKTRWRSIFTKRIELRSVMAPKIIACCCAMHKLCHLSGDILEVDDEENLDGDDFDHNPDNGEAARADDAAEGVRMRVRFAQQMSTPVECPRHLAQHDYFMLRANENEN